jgi:hypothetical protein
MVGDGVNDAGDDSTGGGVVFLLLGLAALLAVVAEAVVSVASVGVLFAVLVVLVRLAADFSW